MVPKSHLRSTLVAFGSKIYKTARAQSKVAQTVRHCSMPLGCHKESKKQGKQKKKNKKGGGEKNTKKEKEEKTTSRSLQRSDLRKSPGAHGSDLRAAIRERSPPPKKKKELKTPPVPKLLWRAARAPKNRPILNPQFI